MTIIDAIWFRPYEFQNKTFENTNAFRFTGLRVQFVPLFYSLKKSSFVRCWKIFSEFRAKYLVFVEGTN